MIINYTAVQYYLVEDKTQEEVCKIFKCSPRSLMSGLINTKKKITKVRWINL
jgi:hypothetical protein